MKNAPWMSLRGVRLTRILSCVRDIIKYFSLSVKVVTLVAYYIKRIR